MPRYNGVFPMTRRTEIRLLSTGRVTAVIVSHGIGGRVEQTPHAWMSPSVAHWRAERGRQSSVTDRSLGTSRFSSWDHRQIFPPAHRATRWITSGPSPSAVVPPASGRSDHAQNKPGSALVVPGKRPRPMFVGASPAPAAHVTAKSKPISSTAASPVRGIWQHHCEVIEVAVSRAKVLSHSPS